MPTLYVTEPGARIEKEYGRLLVTKDDQILTSVPFARVSELVLIGRVGLTTPALHALLQNGVAVNLLNYTGQPLGRLQPPEAHNLPLRQLQYVRGENKTFCLNLGRAIIRGKLRNSRSSLRRALRLPRVRNNVSVSQRGMLAIERIGMALQKIEEATTLADLRGLEGGAAREYFGLFKELLRSEFRFEKRSRRPPRDPANALLSLTYSLLTQATFSACLVVGLDPYDGFFHADAYGRPALALDLMEEFRPSFADSLVLSLINKRILTPPDFQHGEEDGIFLKPPALRKFIRQFHSRLLQPVYHPDAGRALSYQKVFELQARRLRRTVEDPELPYQSFQRR